MIRRTIVAAAWLAFAAILQVAPARAQTRAFVSVAGNDSNSCINAASPCRHFQQAYDKMPNGGEIDVLDPANYGALSVTHTLSIVGRGWATLSPVAGQSAITINAGASDKIAISGLILDGANLSSSNGILFISGGGNLTVRDSVIQNFKGYGILFEPHVSDLCKISVSNTVVSDNTQGIYIGPTGEGFTRGILDHVHIENNTGDGITIISSQTTRVTVTDSVIANNDGSGFIATTQAGGNDSDGVRTFVRNSTIVNNGGFGLEAVNAPSVIFFTRSLIAGNSSGYDSENSGFLASYRDNNVDLNDGGQDSSQTTAFPYK